MLRVLETSLFKEEFDGVTRTARHLFLGLLFNASDDGEYPYFAPAIASEIFFNDGITIDEILTSVAELQSAGLVEVTGDTLVIKGFYNYISHFNQHRVSSWIKTKAQVFHRDGYKCVYCGKIGTQIDHIFPKSKGGSNELSNLVASCWPCNNSKKNKPVGEWYFNQPFFTETRWAYIAKILAS